MDPDTITQIYEANYRLVWNLCYTYLRNVQDVEDAVQDTFLRLIQSRRDFPTDEAVRAWLIVTARNVCRDELKRSRRSNLPLEDADGRAAPIPEPDETLSAVRSLPDKYKAPIYLFYYEGLSTTEISRLLSRRESTVRSDLRRGRLLLRQMLERST